MFNPRPAQAEVISYINGFMGVSAVPGSGKTHTLSCLAAKLIAENRVIDEQEVLIVTLVNSAVENFTQRIRGFLQERQLLTDLGYRVRTLHGLAHDIIREKPEAVGLDTQFSILDEAEQNNLIYSLAKAWLIKHPEFKEFYQDPQKEKSTRPDQWSEYISDLGSAFINTCKDFEKTPEDILALYENTKLENPLIQLGIDVYSNYQRMLTIRGAVDFSDLIRLAIKALENDEKYLERLRLRWPFILEDEAQDSSQLQQRMLALLAGSQGNWVRVGDPNQAIYETFTTANPKHLIDFMRQNNVQAKSLPNSGRSTISIIALANELIRWSNTSKESEIVSTALNLPYIEPTPVNDPQPNPPDKPDSIFLYKRKLSERKEIELIVKSVHHWLNSNPEKTLAVLAPRNARATKIAEALQATGVETVELLHTTQTTRIAAGKISTCVHFLSDPSEKNFLALSQMFIEDTKDEIFLRDLNRCIKNALKSGYLETFLFSHSQDPFGVVEPENLHPLVMQQINELRSFIQRWQNAALLPIDQFILVICQDIFSDPVDLAIGYKIAVLLENAKRIHPEWQLEEISIELQKLATNKIRLTGFSDADTGFSPEAYKGKAVIATIHKAKGLEWDRVYLVSVNNYDFPLAQTFDRYQGETWFIRDGLNLQAEMLAWFQWLNQNESKTPPKSGEATASARIQYAAERLRLFYVGITRAREDLIITWNNGRENFPALQAMAFNALCSFWEKYNVQPE